MIAAASLTRTPTPSASGHWPGARGPLGGPFHRGGFFARVTGLSLPAGGRFAPSRGDEPSAAG